MASFLIVDEDRNFREALAIALRLDGHDATVTAAVDDGRERLAARTFDCCVVDAHLPGADALLEAAAAAGARAIATGPYADLLAAAAARHPNAETLAKPFRAYELAARALDLRASAAGSYSRITLATSARRITGSAMMPSSTTTATAATSATATEGDRSASGSPSGGRMYMKTTTRR